LTLFSSPEDEHPSKKNKEESANKGMSKDELLATLDPNSEEYMMVKMGFPVDFNTTKVGVLLISSPFSSFPFLFFSIERPLAGKTR
jgi:hypothetical protein